MTAAAIVTALGLEKVTVSGTERASSPDGEFAEKRARTAVDEVPSVGYAVEYPAGVVQQVIWAHESEPLQVPLGNTPFQLLPWLPAHKSLLSLAGRGAERKLSLAGRGRMAV